MKLINLLTLATASTSEDRTFVYFSLDSNGSSSRFYGAFPSLEKDVVNEMGHEPFLVELASNAEARTLFNAACSSYADNHDSLLTGTIALVEHGRVVEFDLDDDDHYPVVSENGIALNVITALL